MTNIERRLIISQLDKARKNHFNMVHRAIMKSKKTISETDKLELMETPEIDDLIELLGAGKV